MGSIHDGQDLERWIWRVSRTTTIPSICVSWLQNIAQTVECRLLVTVEGASGVDCVGYVVLLTSSESIVRSMIGPYCSIVGLLIPPK